VFIAALRSNKNAKIGKKGHFYSELEKV